MARCSTALVFRISFWWRFIFIAPCISAALQTQITLDQQTILHSQAPGSKRSPFQTRAETSCISRTYLVRVLSPLQETWIEMSNEPDRDISVHDPCFRSSTILADTGIIFLLFQATGQLGGVRSRTVVHFHVHNTPKEILHHHLSVSISPWIPGSSFLEPDHNMRSQAEIAKAPLIPRN